MARTEDGKRKKAGGTGKKGKVFMEDKAHMSFKLTGQSQLLSMMNDIADSQSAVIKAKIAKVRGPDEAQNASATKGGKPAGKTAGGTGKAVKTSGDIKRAERAKALDEAKKAIMEREKEKRDRKKARKAGVEVPAPKDGKTKKRVGFA